jgi:hypothetical protein
VQVPGISRRTIATVNVSINSSLARLRATQIAKRPGVKLSISSSRRNTLS